MGVILIHESTKLIRVLFRGSVPNLRSVFSQRGHRLGFSPTTNLWAEAQLLTFGLKPNY
ncbi:MAG: hypothetical protein MUC60_04345 [Oscillatoria sp. Prado101]|nr:hypothetical protein [Oscillatoria sp. Prado101]